MAYSPGYSIPPFGVSLRNELAVQTLEWLKKLDGTICFVFGIPISETEEESLRLGRVFTTIAKSIASYTVGVEFEEEAYAPPLCPRFLESINAAEVATNQYFAEQEARRDAEGMRSLLHVLESAPDDAHTIQILASPIERKKMVDVLVSFPPELARQGLSSCTLEISTLVQALRAGEKQSLPSEARARIFEAWKGGSRSEDAPATNRGVYLSLLLRNALSTMLRINVPSFLNLLVPKSSKGNIPEKQLPPVPWAYVSVQHEIADASRLTHTRTGLSSVGQRIVATVSVVWQLLACGLFVPGKIESSLLHSVSVVEMERARAVKERIEHDLLFLSAGEELDFARQCVRDYRGSHIENEVFDSVRHLSMFSIEEIYCAFDSRGIFHAKTFPALRKKTTSAMIHSPKIGEDAYGRPIVYSGFVSESLATVCALLFEFRARGNISSRGRVYPIGDLLRTIPKIRNWKPEDGILVLEAEDVKNGISWTKNLLLDISSRTDLNLCHYARRKTKNVYTFNTSTLAAVLGEMRL